MKNNNDIGFVLIKLNNNPIFNQLLNTIKMFSVNNPFDQTVIFNSYCDTANTLGIPILHLSHAKFFYGKLFVFDLAGLFISKHFTNISKRYLYTNDIPWIKSSTTPYSNWLNMYNHDNLDIIVSDQQLYDIYNIAWKKPIGITETFDYEKIARLL
jgi:hypothetical protein